MCKEDGPSLSMVSYIMTIMFIAVIKSSLVGLIIV